MFVIQLSAAYFVPLLIQLILITEGHTFCLIMDKYWIIVTSWQDQDSQDTSLKKTLKTVKLLCLTYYLKLFKFFVLIAVTLEWLK